MVDKNDASDAQSNGARKSKLVAPDTLLILFWLAILAWLSTFFVPAGQFLNAEEGISLSNFELVGVEPRPVFASGGEAGLLNTLFDGLVSGGAYAPAVGLVAFLLIIGGSFGIILRTGAMEAGINALLAGRDKPADWLPPVLFSLFSLGGATFGMAEESIAFTLLLLPAFLRLGYDSLTVIFITFMGTVTGFYSSWMNPFSVVVAQGIAEVPALSGAGFRGALWVFCTAVGSLWIWRYAKRVQRKTITSLASETDKTLIAQLPDVPKELKFGLGHMLILAVMVGGIAWAIWGVATQGYYFPELGAQFLAMGLVSAIIGSIFRLNGMNFNEAAQSFQHGAAQFLPAILMIGVALGIVVILGGGDPGSPSVFNTIIATLGGAAASVPDAFAGIGMFLSQATINIFVVSGSGQAALTMPIMTPLADITGLSRQTAVLAFQLGDGMTNIITPLNSILIGCLTLARLSWMTWLRFIWRYFAIVLVMNCAVMFFAVWIGFS